MSLLQTALETQVIRHVKKVYNDEEIELAIAWAQGKITDGQAKVALGVSSANGVGKLQGALKQAVRGGVLVRA